MKASELIKELQESINSFGDLDVVVYADHGQAQMICQGAGKQLVEDSNSEFVIEIYGDGYYS